MSKIICSPGSYVQGNGEIRKLPYTAVVFGGECSDVEIKKHQDNLNGANVILGIGGGKTLDTTKAVAYHTGIPMIIVPTAASSDAPCSRLSVVYTEDHEFDHYLPLNKNPDMVIMDTEIIAKAPVRFLMAGIGDALATYYEAAASVQSDAVTMAGGHATKALENIVEANTYLSGIGFESSGLAAAHAIHNGLTVLNETHALLHGEKVAFGLICQLVLENTDQEELEKIIVFCKKCSLPTTFEELGIAEVSDERLLEAAALSCAEDDTMGNMPFEVSAQDVFAAMKTADRFSRDLR